MTLRSLILSAALLAAVSSALTGCGRRSSLQTPSQAAAAQARQTGISTAPEQAPAAEPAEDKRFILDGLIE